MTYNSKYIEVNFNQLPQSVQVELHTAVRCGDAETARRIIYDAFKAEHPDYDPAQANHALIYVYPTVGKAPWFVVSDRIGFSAFDDTHEARVMAALESPRAKSPLERLATSMSDSTIGSRGWCRQEVSA